MKLMVLSKTTELDCSLNSTCNTAVMLHNKLSDHGELKLPAHMINPYYNSYIAIF